jgi:DeoR family glycerol-3-phosphate regulon repressor
MPRNERQERILDLVRRHGFATIDALAEQFKVTPQTIRRDINYLSKQSLLRRYHGGAGMASTVENVAYQTRQILCHEEKRRIAAMLARHIPDGASLFINIGTTTEEVARALARHGHLKVITNNLNVAAIMSTNADIEVTIAGGVVRSRDGGIIGEATVDFVRQFKVDYGIIGISGIDGDGSLLDFDYREVRVARAIIDNARRVCLVVDHTKFGRSAMARLASIGDVDAVYTDRPPPEAIRKILSDNKVDLYVAGGVADSDENGDTAISA